MNNANRINQDSGNFEYYTPKEIVDAARQCMGGIDLDPASSLAANLIVQADHIFTKETDGMKKVWTADTLWMNHPFSRGEKACPAKRARCKKKTCVKRGHHIDHDIPSNMDWISKLLHHYEQGHVKEAICITFANTSEAWFRKLLPFPQCMPNKRIQYYKPDGTIDNNVTKGSAITYLGPNLDNFANAFRDIGTIKIEY
ncbi:TPA: DNA N-6-adenine-methyltransferase [Vibrio parahaemolyticus]